MLRRQFITGSPPSRKDSGILLLSRSEHTLRESKSFMKHMTTSFYLGRLARVFATGQPQPSLPPYRPSSAAAWRVPLTALLALLAVLAPGQAQTLPDLITYTFTVLESKTLPGTSTTPGPPCNGTLAAADKLQNLALAANFYQNSCYTDGRYNHNNYPVDRGTVAPSGGAGPLAAYRIYEPLNKATQFLASKHVLYYRFPTIENYSVYSLTGGSLTKVAEVLAAAIPNTTDFVPVPTANPISVSEVVGSVTYVFAPSATRVSSYTLLAPGVEGARVAATPFGDVLKYRYTVTGTPFDTATDLAVGPGDFNNTYSSNRRFFVVRNGNAGLGAVWQDQVNSALKLTWFGADRRSPTTVALANPAAQILACATGDDAGNVFYLTVQPGSGAPNTPRNATLTKAGPTGATLATTAVDTSAAGLNMVEFFKVASMNYLNGKLAVLLGRTMLQSGDGLNHQGGIAVVFNATTLAVERNWGQTSGHSWESVLTTNANGQFVALDLGDNFPRGIHLHKFTGASKNSRVISSYKTAHGTTPQSPSGATYPVYTEISGGGTTYYRWSNDNRTYTELGGIAQTTLGYAASFVGERSPAGRLIDNSRVGGYLNDPRNVGFITVREDFQNASGSGSEVSDDLVLTPGLVETAGFYTFTGGWTPQRNAGVVWLTSYASLAQNASRLKMTARADGSLLLLWELWTDTSYVTTKGMTVAANGTVVNAETALGTQVRLGRREDLFRLNNDLNLVAGNKTDPALELIVIEAANALAPSATTQAATGVTNNAATLKGSANPNGTAAIGFFQWGASTSYGTSTTPVNVGNGTSAVALSTPVSGLTPGVIYHYRAAVSNSFGIFYGGDMQFNTVVIPTPTINLAATALTAQGCVPNNGVIDPGETVTVNFTLTNQATIATANLTATLLTTNGVVSPSAPQSYGALVGGGAAPTRAFSFMATGACGGTITARLQLVDGASSLGTVSATFPLGIASAPLVQSFDSVAPPALPAGWTASWTGVGAAWVTTAASSSSAPNAAFAPNPDNISDNSLVSPAFAINTASAQLSFRHSYVTETTYDGGVLEISTNGGAFTDLLAAGGSFIVAGYNQTVATGYGNPLAGRQAWSGNSGGYVTTTANLPAIAAGKSVRLRWRLGSDNSTAALGWYVDTIAVSDGYACCVGAPAPIVTTLAATAVTNTTATLNGSANPNGSAAIGYFQWGTTTSYGSNTVPVNLGNGTSAVVLTRALSGLTPGVTYHYRAAGSNSTGVVYGADLTFTTPVLPSGPTVTTVAASSVTKNSATLNGSANPNGAATIGFLQWGTNTSYGASSAPVNLGSGTAAVPFSTPLTWLTAGVTYHFRAAASNVAGVVYGNNMTFTTPVVYTPPVSTFTGGDAGEGLDLQGSFAYAVNVGGNGAPGLIGNANFTTDSSAGVSLTAPGGAISTLDDWAAPSFGATPNDDRLELAMRSIRFCNWPTKLIVNLGSLQAGRSYKLQLLFIEQCCDRVFDVKVNSATVATAFRLLDFGPFGTPLAVTHTFTATGSTALIELGGGTIPAGRDGNPTLSAFTLEDLGAANPNTLKIARSGGSAAVSWPAGLRGVLQERTNLTAGTWTYSPSGTTNPITLAATGPAKFYRLVVSPTNDNFAGRTVLTGAPINQTASNVGATKEASEPAHAGNAGGRSLWWSWTAPANGPVTVSLAGSSFDTTQGVYTGTAVTVLTMVAQNDDYDGNLYSRVTFTATAGVTYQIAVDGYNNGPALGGAEAGTIQLNITQ